MGVPFATKAELRREDEEQRRQRLDPPLRHPRQLEDALLVDRQADEQEARKRGGRAELSDEEVVPGFHASQPSFGLRPNPWTTAVAQLSQRCPWAHIR
jgi:hypothetical protein